MTNFIGRLRNVGFGKETARGTAIAPTFWAPAMEFSNDDKIVQVINESSLGVIADADDAKIVKKYSEAEIVGKINNEGFGLLALNTFGFVNAPALVGGETIVYDHEFNVLEGAQHPSLTIAIESPNDSLAFPLAMIESLEIKAELEKFVQYDAILKTNASEPFSSTPAYVDENIFLPQYCTATFYPNYTDLGTNTNPETYAFRSFTVSISKNLEDDQVLGDIGAVDRLNKQFVVEGTLELLYTDRVLIDDILMGDDMRALKILMVNTDVTLGVASNPEIEIDLAKVKFSEIAREQGNNDLVKQTVSFKAFYSITDTLQISMRLRNLQATQY